MKLKLRKLIGDCFVFFFSSRTRPFTVQNPVSLHAMTVASDGILNDNKENILLVCVHRGNLRNGHTRALTQVTLA